LVGEEVDGVVDYSVPLVVTAAVHPNPQSPSME
jgi:hypothetical protein